jgi:hypothetical protein
LHDPEYTRWVEAMNRDQVQAISIRLRRIIAPKGHKMLLRQNVWRNALLHRHLPCCGRAKKNRGGSLGAAPSLRNYIKQRARLHTVVLFIGTFNKNFTCEGDRTSDTPGRVKFYFSRLSILTYSFFSLQYH